jgi:hypothetical protein
MSTKGASVIAAGLIAGTEPRGLGHWLAALADDDVASASQAARVVDELVQQQPALLVPQIRTLVAVLERGTPRAAQTAAHALHALVALAPAKVARHMDRLRQAFDTADEHGKDGIVLTFAALCSASIAYQKRVVDVLERALGAAEPRTLQRWSEQVLPALKGEPYAQARSVVEARLPDLPRPVAQKLAAQLGVRLRSV